jgi:hypothetical protein
MADQATGRIPGPGLEAQAAVRYPDGKSLVRSGFRVRWGIVPGIEHEAFRKLLVLLVARAAGSAVILAAFAASQFGLASGSSHFYLAVSVIGSLALAASALLSSQWGFLVLGGTWCVVSAFSIGKAFARPRTGRGKGAAHSPSMGRAGAMAAKG